MSFRRDPKHDREHAKWTSVNRDYLLRSGIPLVAWETWDNWEDFLYDDLPYEIDPSHFDIEDLTDAEALELCLFLERECGRTGSSPTVLRRLQSNADRRESWRGLSRS
jgi:hypothetical protein